MAATALVRVYCDLDGVLADFNRGCLELFPEGGSIAEKIPTHTVTKLSHEEETQMWHRIETKADFFLSLDWMPDGEELWRWMDSNIVPTPAILTGLPVGRAGQMAAKQKVQWCHQKLGGHVAVFCCGTRNKQKFSGQKCVLVDDRGDLREAWEARGGIFIHHTSAPDSIRQLLEVMCNFRHQPSEHGIDNVVERPLQLMSICWAAQTPSGCFRPNCRYLHVPISRQHRSWIQLWCFVWWNQRMFDDLDGLVACVRAVYSPYQEVPRCLHNCDMNEQSHGAFSKMFDTLRESCEVGLPFAFLRSNEGDLAPSLLPPLPWQVKAVMAHVEKLLHASESLGPSCSLMVAGSRGLGVDVDGSDLDLVLSCPVELEPLSVLRAVEVAIGTWSEVKNLVLVDSAATPVLTFECQGLCVDVAVNQMSSIRDALLFRYALRNSTPDLIAMLRLLKLWLKRRWVPVMKQGGFPTLLWVRMAIRFYQEQSHGPRRVAKDWLFRFLQWASGGLSTGGAPLTVHGEQAESCSDRIAAGVPPATLICLVTEIHGCLQTLSAGMRIVGAVREEFLCADPHTNLCRVGNWGNLRGLFYVRTSAAGSEVILCRVQGVFGGTHAELRCCNCETCKSSVHVQPVKYVSRRSREWFILARREDPQRLRIQAALRNARIHKRRFVGMCDFPNSHEEQSEDLLLAPRHFITLLKVDADPVQQLEHMQGVVADHAWLPIAEPVGGCFCRGFLLSVRSQVQPSMLCWSLLPIDTLYAQEPQRRLLEMARAKDESLARLRQATTLSALELAVREEFPFAVGTRELQEAEARLAALLSISQASVSPNACQEMLWTHGDHEDHQEMRVVGHDNEREEVALSEQTESSRWLVTNDTGPNIPVAKGQQFAGVQFAAAKISDGTSSEVTQSIEVRLEKIQLGDILGFSCKVDPSDPTSLQVASISEHGLLGRYNQDVQTEKRISEGSKIVAVNGVQGDAVRLQRELEHTLVVLSVVPDRHCVTDASGRRKLSSTISPSFQVHDGLLTCRCTSQCKCGLADALGRAHRAYDSTRSPWPALRVGNLRPDADEEALYTFFSSIGPVATVRIVRDTRTWRSERHGFVNFRTFHDAKRALDMLNGKKIKGHRCRLTWSARAQRKPDKMCVLQCPDDSSDVGGKNRCVVPSHLVTEKSVADNVHWHWDTWRGCNRAQGERHSWWHPESSWDGGNWTAHNTEQHSTGTTTAARF